MTLLLISQTRISKGIEIDSYPTEYLRDDVHEVLVPQTKIGDVFLQKTDSALLDDGSDDVLQMQIPHLIPCIKARSNVGAM